MTDSENKIIFENIVKEILNENSLLDDNLDIIRDNETLSYNRYIEIYKPENITNINSFNNNFESLGGRIYLKNDPVVKSLNIVNSLINYSDKYIYVIPNYQNDYDYINELINSKLKKLNENKNILVIASPIRANSLKLDKELNLLNDISKNNNYSYSKIVIINLNKIIIIDLINNNFNTIEINN